jgi:hypothetical protein
MCGLLKQQMELQEQLKHVRYKIRDAAAKRILVQKQAAKLYKLCEELREQERELLYGCEGVDHEEKIT